MVVQEELCFHAVIGKFRCAVLVHSSLGTGGPVARAAHSMGPPSRPGPHSPSASPGPLELTQHRWHPVSLSLSACCNFLEEFEQDRC